MINLKSRKRKIIFFSILSVILVAATTITITLLLLSRIDYVLTDTPTYEVNSEVNLSSLFSNLNEGAIENEETSLDTSEIGDKTIEVTLVSKLGTKKTVSISYNVTDTTPPTIFGDENELSFEAGKATDILSHYSAEDNSGQPVDLSIAGDYDLETPGEYQIKIVAKDKSNNTSEKSIALKITAPPQKTTVTSTKSPYYIEVNREQNVVIVYSRSSDGSYSNVAKVFVASTGAPGSETPLGTFTISDRYETLYLVGNVWGHYTVRISGPYFFHSVPYFTKGAPWDNLEYLEYNKLGSPASAGCVRLATIDAKWIYDNVPYGTTVKIYDSPTLPTGISKPSAIKIDESSEKRGWDPTDEDPANPWHQ